MGIRFVTRVAVTSLVMTAFIAPGSSFAAPAANAPSAAPTAVHSSHPTSATDATKVPHYYGPWPNWALSPLTTSTAEVSITDASGAGTGATGTALIDPATGGITAIDVTNPGHDYVTPVVAVTGSTSHTEATATATASASGGVVAYTIPEDPASTTTPKARLGGGGYTGFTVTVADPASGTTATADGFGSVDSVDVGDGGSGYTMPSVEFALPDDPAGVTATGHVEQTDLVGGVVQKVTIDTPGSGYATAPEVVIHNGTLMDPIAGATPPAGMKTTLALSSVVVRELGTGYTTVPTVTVTDTATPAVGTGAQVVANVDVGGITGIAVNTNGSGYLKVGIRKFQDQLPNICDPQQGCPTDPSAKFIPIGVPEAVTYSGQAADQYVIGLVQYRTRFNSDLPPTLVRGYVQLETPANAAYSQHFPLTNELLDGTKVAVKDGAGNPVLGVTSPQWLGPTLIATKDKPVRVVFHNYLPKGADGDLFLPTDSTMMGSGMGPMPMDAGLNDGTVLDDVRNPACTQEPKPTMCFKDNRATLHLHGGTTPWISDGTPHQWITPSGETTDWPQGVSVSDVPDMKDSAGNVLCGADRDGCQTFYYTNQQSARLMFYHDHAWGITRLNVYAGEAAGYIITDDVEKKLIADRLIPGAADTIPLIVQDRTFVPGDEQLKDVKGPDGNIISYGQDPTWDAARWGTKGSFWYHHVYMPAQNPADSGGMSAYGRWMYGPWFWPPATGTVNGPIDNPYYDPACSVDNPDTWQYQTDPFCEPAVIPGTPNISAGMEQFNDTPIVNGVAYPTVTLDPKAYRLRILNAANDRFFNLQWYQGDPTTGNATTGLTEVKLKQSELDAAQTDPNVFPTPQNASYTQPNGTKVNSTDGPDWVQIANEGGFLPTPAVIDGQQPTTWITDPTRFDVGNVDQHSMLVAPAERSDVVVDFSKYAGKTLILYNDAPAAFPARVSSYDYYTGAPDLSPVGAPGVLPGFGPNTRTVMQVKIRDITPASAFNVTALTNAFKHKLDGSGVFEKGQHPIVVGQAAYNTAYGSSFAATGNCNLNRALSKCDGYVRVADYADFTFNTLRQQGTRQKMPLQPKAIHDEMNSTTFDEFGRMQANLGVEASPPTPGAQNVTLYPFVNPQTELIDGTKLPKDDLTVTPISDLGDGTQLWRITHNGVDTHPIHFHLYDVQVINRVTWDNILIPNDPNENGWKDTVRVSPLEDTIVALRPIIPKAPFEVPNSVRPLSPMMESGSTAMFFNVDVNGNPTTPITNKLVNFGWEYVYHCHILSHEEMDMMRPVSLALPPRVPDQLVRGQDSAGNPTLTWSDNSITETSFDVMRSRDGGATWTKVGGTTSPLDQVNDHGVRTTSISLGTDPDVAGTTRYKVVAHNVVGYGGDFPSMDVSSESQQLIVGAPLTPSNLAFTLGDPEPVAGKRAVTLTWTPDADPAMAGQTFTIQRSATADFAAPVAIGSGLHGTSFTDPTLQAQNTTVYYRIMATLGGGLDSQWSPGLEVLTLASLAPAAPTGLAATPSAQWPLTVTVAWAPVSDASGVTYAVQRATDAAFTTGVLSLGTGLTSTSVVDSTAEFATLYYYRVTVTNGFALTAEAATSLTTPAGTLVAPTGVTRVVAASGATPTLVISWAGQPWATSYTVQVARNTSFTTGLITQPGLTVTNTTVPGLVSGVLYYVRVQAVRPNVANTVTVTGPWSTTVQRRMSPPAMPNLTATAPGGGQIVLAWSAAPATQPVGAYQIQIQTATGWVNLTTTATGTSYTVSGLTPGVRYSFRMRGINSAGAGTWSDTFRIRAR